MRLSAPALGAALFFFAHAAYADRVALLPSRGGLDPNARAQLDADLAKGLAALGHTLVPAQDVANAVRAGAADGVADTVEEYRAIGGSTQSDWVLAGVVDPAVISSRVELSACFVRMGRVESVAREVNRNQSPQEVQEMLAVLVRPEGIGAGELPWEKGKPPMQTPPPQPPPQQVPPPFNPFQPQFQPQLPPQPPPPPGKASIDYMRTTEWVWPVYSAGHRGFLGAQLGFSMPAVRPEPHGPSKGAAMVALVRGGYAVGDRGIELFGELGGNLAGPKALFVGAGVRWMLNPTLNKGQDGVSRGISLFLGPAIVAGAFVRFGASTPPEAGSPYSSSTVANAMLGASFDFIMAITPRVQAEASLGNLRWVPTGDGSILMLGATLGVSFRF